MDGWRPLGLRCSAVLWLCLVAAVAPLAAQGTTSRVTGVVSDSSGGVIPGATVTLTNDGTNISFTTVSTDAGTYTFEAVQVGTYTVKVELPGFKTFISTGNIVAIGQPRTVNARLETGTLTEEVKVTGGSETVQLSTSGNYGTVIDQRAVETLPIVGARGRNPLQLVLTQPGVVSGANTGGGVHVNGARDRSWNFTLDGIDINETSAGGANFSSLRTNPDSLSEFKVLTGNTTAEFGRNSGGQVAMVSRSGTNDFKGTGFYFARRTPWAANEWENNINQQPKRQFDQNIGGFSLGGPIKRGKAFFFINTQVLRATQTNIVTRTVYTATARQGQWRFVPGGRNQPAGVTGASVDASGNVLPGIAIATYDVAANDPLHLGLNAQTQRLIAMTPLPNNFATGDGLNTAGYTFSTPEFEKQHDISTKVDYVVNERNYTFARVSWGQQNTECDSANSGQPSFPGLPCAVNTERDPLNFVVSWRWNPKSSLVNELVVGRNHFTFNFVNPNTDVSKPTYTFSSLTMPQDFTYGNLRTLNTFQIVDNVSYVRGAHSFKGGVNIRLQQHKDIRGSVGSANVAALLDFGTGSNSVDPTLFALPSTIQTANDRPLLQSSINFLLGRVNTYSQGFVSDGSAYAPGGTPFIFDARFPEADLFVQDTWKPRQNLTVDLGLRWELKYAPNNPQNLIRRPNQRVAVNEPGTNGLTWVSEPLYGNDLNNLGPSAGIAWDPTGEGKQVIRGNYRLAYDRINTFVISSAILQSIPGITNTTVNTDYGLSGGRAPADASALPSLQPSSTPDQFLTPTVSAASMRVMDTDFQSPYTHGWAFSYQRELWTDNVLEVAYIGRRAEHLFGAYNVNQAIINSNGFLDAYSAVKAGGESDLINRLLANDTRRNATETGSQFMRRQYATEMALNSVGAIANAIGSRLQSGRTLPELAGLGSTFFFPYPQFLGGVTVIDSNDGSRYNALQLKLERRFRKGLGYVLGYTLAKSMDTRSFDPAFTTAATGNSQSASSTPFDIYNRSLNYAPSDFDRRHVFQASFVTALPFGKGQWIGGNVSDTLDRIIGGWELSGFMMLESGRPFTVYSGANTISNVVQTPADCAGCSDSVGSVHDEGGLVWYLTPEERAKYSTPGAGAFGSAGRNSVYGARFFDLDLALVKRVRLAGTHAVEFRVDATNVTNTPSFGFPTATITSTTFGRIRDTVASSSRKVQLGVKYNF
jgi:hypothetical protein